MKTAAILNPRAAAGRAGRLWPGIEEALREGVGEFALLRTEQPGHATDLVRQALRDGCERIISVGGDGTHHEVVNGFFDGTELVNPEAILGVLPLGTGSDLGRTLRLPRGVAAVPLLTRGTVVQADIGRVAYTLPGGRREFCHFINVADFGAGGVVAEHVNLTSKQFGGFAAFFWGVMRTLVSYRAPHFELDIDGESIEQRALSVIVANGEYYGGGIHVAPQARLDSGAFEVYVIKDVSLFTALINLRKFYQGRLLELPRLVRHFRATRLALRSPERVLINLDGELPGLLPAEIELVPRTIRLVSGYT